MKIMKTNATGVARLISAGICAVPLIAFAGPTEEPAMFTPPPVDEWEFRLQPYGWLTGIDGTIGPDGFPSDIDAGFDDVFDVLDMAAALQFEARRGRWGFMVDAFYAELGNSGTLPGPLKTHIDADFQQVLGEFVVLYRVTESPDRFVDLYAGIRHNSLDLDITAKSTGTLLNINDSRSADQSWTDPIIGVRSQWEINDSWYLAAKGDIGGFGVDSDFTWNLQGTVGYRFNKSVSLEVGYRYFDTDYSDGGFTYDVAQSGAVIGLNFNF